ncbi:MAG: hypothetical protein R6T83_04075 [Salinibacter sp.]
MLFSTTLSSRFLGWAAGTGLLACTLIGIGGVQPADAQFRDVGYTLEPTVVNVFGADNAAFHDEPLYGGALGLGFGRSFELSGEYLINTGATAELSRVDGLEGLVDRSVDVRRYGGRMRINLASGQFQPYLTAGTGALRLDPEGADPTRTIYAIGGAGLTFSARNQYRVSLGGEMLSYRYDPVETFLGPNSGFESNERLVRSPSLTASVSLFLGGRAPGEPTALDRRLEEQFGQGGILRNTQLFVNPFYGRIEFNDALNFPKDQNLTGVNAGVELGPYVGLRGFYWRATTGDDLLDEFADGFEGMELYGGELRLRLNAELGRGFVPYATLGGGFLNVQGDYEDDIPEQSSLPADRFFSMAGGGLEVPVSRNLKLSGGLRSMFMSDQNIEGVDDPGDVRASLMYSAGIEFRIGGGGRAPRPEEGEAPPRAPMPEAQSPSGAEDDETSPDEAAPEETPPEREAISPRQAELMAEVDSLQQALETLRGERQAERALQARSVPARDTTIQSTVSGRTITIPVPTNGELYVRYGDGGGAPQATRRDTVAAAERGAGQPSAQMRPEAVERRVEAAVDAALQADTSEVSSEADVDRIVQRAVERALEAQTPTAEEDLDRDEREADQETMRRMEEELAELRERLQEQADEADRSRREAANRSGTEVVTQTTSSDDSSPFYRQTLGRPLTYIVPVTGVRVGEGPNQFQVGLRGDYRLQPESRLHIMPELAVGLGSGETSVSFLANGAYSFLRNRTSEWTNAPLEPYSGLGVGLMSDGGLSFEFVSNLFLGVNYRFANGQTGFIELGTLDVFDTNRFTIGYRIRL